MNPGALHPLPPSRPYRGVTFHADALLESLRTMRDEDLTELSTRPEADARAAVDAAYRNVIQAFQLHADLIERGLPSELTATNQ